MAENTQTTPPAYGRKTLRKLGRIKRKARLLNDSDFRKIYFEGKSKRSNEKKSAFRKKKSGKK